MRRPPRSSWIDGLAVLAVAWVVLAHLVSPTSARLSARVTNDRSRVSTGWLESPGGLTAAAVGQGVQLQWSAGAGGTGYDVRRGLAVSGSCANAPVSSVATPSSSSYSDQVTGPQGVTYCYEVATRAASWTSVNGNPRASVRAGFIVESVALGNNGNGGTVNPGDTITVVFSQPVDPATGPASTATVCVTQGNGTSAHLVLGSSATTGACATSEATTVGVVSGITSSRNVRYAATYSWSADAKTLTITFGSRTVGNGNPNLSGAGTFTPTTAATALLNASDRSHVCDNNAGGNDCLRAVTGSL